MSENIEKAIAQLEKVRSQVVIENIFFGNLILKAKTTITSQIPTAATNGTDYLVNPDFWVSLSQKEQKFVLAHEVLHKAFLHHTRRGSRHPRLWNIAADYAINPILVKAGFTPPDGCLLDDSYTDMSAEQIYKILEEEPQKQPPQPPPPEAQSTPEGQTDTGQSEEDCQAPGSTPDEQEEGGGTPQAGGGKTDDTGESGTYSPGSESWDIGGVEDAPLDPGNLEQSKEVAEQEAKQELQEAATLAEMAGTLPGNVKRFIDEICEPIVNWKAELADFFTERASEDYSFRVRNRRYSGNVVMPGTDSETMADMIFIVDTSGSVTQNQIKQFASEIMYFNDDLQPTRLIVMGVDSRVQSVQEFEQGELTDINEIELEGGGGTRFQPAFDWIEENEADPDVVVYLTDGHCWDKPEDPGYPVLWALTEKNTRFDMGFGQTIYCQIER